MSMTTAEKSAFSDAAYPAIEHPLVRHMMEEYAFNMGFKLAGLPEYGLQKIAMHVAVVARAQALGIDPDTLRSTPDEANATMLNIAASFAAAGKPVIVIATGDES